MSKLIINKVATARGKVTKSTIKLVPVGGETAFVFSVNFDPNVLTFRSSSLAKDLPEGVVLTENLTKSSEGKVGFLIDSATPLSRSKKSIDLLILKFKVNEDAEETTSTVVFSSFPAPKSTSGLVNGSHILFPTTYVDGSVRAK